MKKSLYRNRENRLIAGVLSGLAKYFSQDPTFWRLGFVVFLVVTGFMPGVLIYIVAWIIIPEQPYIQPLHKEEYTVTD
jgi:phage shock protein C